MKPSNVQTKSIVFAGINIQPSKNKPEELEAGSFDWNGVNIGLQTKYKKHKMRAYSVFLRVAIDNKDAKISPYTIDVQVLGLFDYLGKDDEKTIEDLIVVNGLSILYGTLREMVTMITSRMPYGAICLPGANFLDHRPSLERTKDNGKEFDKQGQTKPVKRKPQATKPKN